MPETIDKAMASMKSTATRKAMAAASTDDIYDFSGVASDLAILRSQLLTLQASVTRLINGRFSRFSNGIFYSNSFVDTK